MAENQKSKRLPNLLLILISLIFYFLFLIACNDGKNSDNKADNHSNLPDGYQQRFYENMRFGLFVPPSYDPIKSYPLIIRLHGSTDTVSWDLSWYHDPIQTDDPCFVLSPKTTIPHSGWGTSWDQIYPTPMRITMDVVDSLQKEFNIDTTRLYIHGTSMGGFGVFNVLAKEPGRFAGAFAICGGGDPATANAVKQTPLWIFHGSDDNIVPVSRSRDMYHAIVAAGGREVRYTEYPDVGHEAWTPAWKEPTITSWLLAQQKGAVHSNPELPENLSGEVTNADQVQLSWNPPSDQANSNNHVWYYRIFKDDTAIAELDYIYTTYIDTTVSRSTGYGYNISAVNYFFRESGRTATVEVNVQ
ncbi:prolyl oligopeptidase family serine peptidase [candidate division KSB1 bacterium]|nr:prolyl oligopeptidase family serine peptidase [candidate division KSB1 bacterium]